jgi:hypothetical protein
MHFLEKTSLEFMQDQNGSYSRLARHLNKYAPRPDGTPWTKDSAYHYCRTHGIKSKRPCKNQPSVGIAQRAKTRRTIVTATLNSLSMLGQAINDIAPVELKNVVFLSGAALCNVRNNWEDLADELNSLAGLPRTLRFTEE